MNTVPGGVPRFDLTVVPAPDQRPSLSEIEQQLGEHRRAGVRRALNHIVAGRPGRAFYTMARSLEFQLRVAELGDVPVSPACPCNGRCPHGSRR